ncbi:hypothetical protein GCM10007385_35690 [Tateyamaria omphalii]|uniref:hypothetical protein n=1 Tax=Tateyamaria omphalii TaxID=299262 RepID=UPI0019C2037D|nr:hypothetical protein [Tateyamaria omphalii]GGX63413.1 hypothetical protein GCM10007385_35690 [Tateyamaria omphalii]
MHIPLTQDEIANFLKITPTQVQTLWHHCLLDRSLHCAERPLAPLGYSTIYDVIEYALVAGVLPLTLTRELAALWIAQLAELDEWDEAQPCSNARKSSLMLSAAIDDGLADMTDKPAKVVSTILDAQAVLVAGCLDLQVAS